MTGNGIIPYICYFHLSCFAKENTKQNDHAGRAAASNFNKKRTEMKEIFISPRVFNVAYSVFNFLQKI